MPSIFQQDIDKLGKLGVWAITESPAFFLERVVPQRDVHHPHKQLQHLAGRYLLCWLYPEFPVSLIRVADTRKPYLEQDPFHFSISHCDDFAAAIVSPHQRVGVDIEAFSEKALRIRRKFSTDAEWERARAQWASIITDEVVLATTIWSCKEAVFKWYGLGGVEFREQILLDAFEVGSHQDTKTLRLGALVPWWLPPLSVKARFVKDQQSWDLKIHVRHLNGLSLAWII